MSASTKLRWVGFQRCKELDKLKNYFRIALKVLGGSQKSQRKRRIEPQVAADAVMKMVPGAKVTARHGNIKDSEFNVDWFRGFHIVLNGLDNLDARRHVNR